MRKLFFILAAAFSQIAATLPSATTDSIDAIAREYVVLAVGVQRLHTDWVDAPEVPSELKIEAENAKLDSSAIIERTGSLIERLDALPGSGDHLLAQRQGWLRASLVSLRMQLQASAGTKWPVQKEVSLRFGFEPEFKPLSSYDPVLQRLDQQLSGEGALTERVNRLRASSVVPPERVKVVQKAALDECRRRAAAHLMIPKGESVDLKWIDSPLYEGNNIYKGGGHSVTELSGNFEWEVDRILWVTCHEMYPGHHVHFTTQSAELFKKRGWTEFSLMQNYGPLIPAAEAVAEYGVWLTFPAEDRLKFERDVLYPLAGLKMNNPDDWRAYWNAKADTLGATASVAQEYLDGQLDKAHARDAFVKYRLLGADRADKIIQVIDEMGSYIIASDLGWMTIDSRLRDRPPAEQWKSFQRILEEPMTVADLQGL